MNDTIWAILIGFGIAVAFYLLLALISFIAGKKYKDDDYEPKPEDY